MPFSLDQVHVEEGEPPVWDREPEEWGTGVLSLLYGIAVRDAFPDQFFDAHIALFAARHEHGKQLKDEDVLREAVASAGLDPDAVAEEAKSGRPLKTLAAEHTECVEQYGVFGVPDVPRRRSGRVRALHGPRQRRRPREDARPAPVVGAERVQAAAHPALAQRAQPRAGAVHQVDHRVRPLVEPRVAPAGMTAGRVEIAHVEVQRRRVVGELEQRAAAAERRRIAQEVGERDRGDDPAPARAGRPTPWRGRARR